MSESRDKMVSALRELVVPALREMGFQGSFPHFRRVRGKHLDLATFQFSQWRGAFALNIGYCDSSGYTNACGEHFPPDRVRAHYLHFNQQKRLGSHPPQITDHWFEFEPERPSVYRDAATQVVSLLRSQAEQFWTTRIPTYDERIA